jgi:sulfur-oxidizing protein SoxY
MNRFCRGNATVIDTHRRDLLRQSSGLTVLGLALAAGVLRPAPAWAQQAWNKLAFEAHDLAGVSKALGAAAAPVESKDIVLTGPDIAENGAVVPVGVQSKIARTEEISILIEKNPNMLAGSFDIPPGTEPAISTRVKMGQTSNVYALVKADGRYFVASKEIKVTLGGCGG